MTNNNLRNNLWKNEYEARRELIQSLEMHKDEYLNARMRAIKDKNEEILKLREEIKKLFISCLVFENLYKQRLKGHKNFFYSLEILKDFECGLYLAETGFYRHANSCLRFILENLFRIIDFCFDENKFLLWKKEWQTKNRPFYNLKNERVNNRFGQDSRLSSRIMNLFHYLSSYVHSVSSSNRTPYIDTFTSSVFYDENEFDIFEENCYKLIRLLNAMLNRFIPKNNKAVKDLYKRLRKAMAN